MAAHTNNNYICPTNTTGICLNDSSCPFRTSHISNNTKPDEQETNILTDDLCKDLGNVSSPVHSSFMKRGGFNSSARDRSHYINPVLKPIENLAQWKFVKEDKKDETMLEGMNVNKSNARDRRHHDNPVLNHVENLAQWKLVKAKRVTFADEMRHDHL
ncbi:hypothetical protein TSUD_209300 [Trifolium subterraneum]|uniref:Uncharacterized protein n=1 Tax=Trifolium subterraneum TaxID=3900 RepID=A0A2Z6N3T2_TRISU|nr:hypothetical protein TSUD_209300 [Trifolium subterraneum]